MGDKGGVDERKSNADESGQNPHAGVDPPGTTDQCDGGEQAIQDLDDLFLSASQLVREVNDAPRQAALRKRPDDDHCFTKPDLPPPRPPDRTGQGSVAGSIPGTRPCDEVSPRELLRVDAPAGSPPSEARKPPRLAPPQMSDPVRGPPSPPPADSFAEPFEFCSQDLRDIDALTEPLPAPKSNDPAARTELSGAIGGEDQEPRPFFTGATQELVSLAEMRSRRTAEAEESLRRRGGQSGAGPGSGLRVGRQDEPGAGNDTVPRSAARESCGAEKRAPEAQGPARKWGRTSSLNFDDDEWWEDLENTDLETLLCPT